MQFLLFIKTATDLDPAAPEDAPLEIDEWVEQMDARGVRLVGERLRPAEDATTVRVRKGEVLITAGPLVPGPDHLAGFDLIECTDLEEAIEVARLHPMATQGLVEIRALWPWEG